MLTNDNNWLRKLQLKTYKMRYFVAAIFVVLLLFSDTMILFMGHCLHVMFELIASIIEHWLHKTFSMTERQAQIVFFYLFTIIASFIGWRLTKNVYRRIKNFCISVHCQAMQTMGRVKWPQLTLWVMVFGISMLLLT